MPNMRMKELTLVTGGNINIGVPGSQDESANNVRVNDILNGTFTIRLFVIFFSAFIFFSSTANAQNRQRVAISDVIESFDFKTRPDILGNCQVPGATSGVNGCKVHKYLICRNGQCTPRTTSGATANKDILSTFHPWASAASALEGTENVDVIMLAGPDIQAKISWVENNAEAERIASFVLVHGALSSNFTAAQYANFNNELSVTIVNSAGNEGTNGFNPRKVNQFDMNGLAAHPDTIAVGAGFRPGPGDCDALPIDERSQIQLLCTSNAPNSANGGEHYYVEFGCAPGFVYTDGTACGTSFAAPRVAAIIAEMRNVNPNLSFAQIVSGLSGSTSLTAGGYLFNSGNSQIRYERVDLDGAVAGVPTNTLEAQLTYSISNLVGIVQAPGCNATPYWKWCLTLQFQPLTLTINDTSQSDVAISNRNWSVSPAMPFQEIDNGESISMVVGSVKGTSYYSQKPTSVTLQVTNSNSQNASITVPINYPVITDSTSDGVGCVFTFDEAGTQIADGCTRILFAGDGGNVETAPSPMLLSQDFLYCQGSTPKHIFQVSVKGTIRQYEFQYKAGNGNWTIAGATRKKNLLVNLPSNSNITMRARHLDTFGWSNYQTHSFQSGQCNNNGGWPGGGGGTTTY